MMLDTMSGAADYSCTLLLQRSLPPAHLAEDTIDCNVGQDVHCAAYIDPNDIRGPEGAAGPPGARLGLLNGPVLHCVVCKVAMRM